MSESIELVGDKIGDDYDNKKNDHKKSDLMSISGSIISKINYKISIFLFIVGMILFSDVFINSVLSKIPNSVSGECTTTKGTVLQLTILCLFYLTADLFSQAGWM